MNFLKLCQRLRDECSVSGAGPVSVKDQAGEYARLVNWIQDANNDIQSQFFNWKFLWRKIDLDFKEGDSFIAHPQDLNIWRPDSLWINGYQMEMIENHRFGQQYYRDLAVVMPDNSIILTQKITEDCTGHVEYCCQPQTLTDDADEPWIPEPYQMAIVYRAMMKYANFENAPEIKTAGMEGFQSLMPRLIDNQLPNNMGAGGFANDYDIVVRPC